MKLRTVSALVLALMLLLGPGAAGCSRNETPAPLAPTAGATNPAVSTPGPGSTLQQPNAVATIEVTGMATEIAGNNLSMNSQSGPLVLRFDANTVVVRFDGSAGAITEVRPGMTIRVFYDAATKIATRIEIV